MKIEQLIYFSETARLEHIGKASKILGISTSAISHSIAALESELGQNLFQKKGKNIVLTDHGRHLYHQSQDLINQFQNLKQDLLGPHHEKMYFQIAASHHLSHQFVAPCWAKLSPEYPRVTLEIVTYRSSEVVKAVLAREAHFGICFSPQENPELHSEKIYQGELLLTVALNHPACKEKGALQQMKALNDYPAILPKAFQGIDVCISHPMFERFGITPKATTLIDSYDVSLELIKDTEGWGLMPDLLLKGKKKGMTFIKPRSEWVAPFNVSVIALKKRFSPTFLKDLTKELSKKLNEKGPA